MCREFESVSTGFELYCLYFLDKFSIDMAKHSSSMAIDNLKAICYKLRSLLAFYLLENVKALQDELSFILSKMAFYGFVSFSSCDSALFWSLISYSNSHST